MKEKGMKKRILSLLLALALVLCMGAGAGDVWTAKAAEGDSTELMGTTSSGEEGNGSAALNTPKDGDAALSTEEDGDAALSTEEDGGAASSTEENGDAASSTEENGDAASSTEENGSTASGAEENGSGGGNAKEEAPLTEEEIDEIAGTIFDALYPAVEAAFLSSLGQLKEAVGGSEESSEGFYGDACALLVEVASGNLDTAKEQEEYADLKNEKVYENVYNRIYNKLYIYIYIDKDEDKDEPETETGDEQQDALKLTFYSSRTAQRTTPIELTESSSPKFSEQIDTDTDSTYVEVYVGGTLYGTYAPGDAINLEDVDSNKGIKFVINTAYQVRYGHKVTEGEDAGEDDGTLDQRDLVAGDYFTVSGIPEALEFPEGTEVAGILQASIDGSNVDMVTVTGPSNATKDITYTFMDNVSKDLDNPYLDIAFTAGLQLELNKAKLNGEDETEFTLSIPGNEHLVTLPKKASTEPEEISKTGSYNSSSHEITWTIDITPENRSLAGYTLKDVFDATYQELVSVSYAGTPLYSYDYDKSVETTKVEGIEVGSTEASGDDSAKTTITYTFPDSAQTSSNGKFIVTTRLNDAAEKILLEHAGKDAGNELLSATNNAYLIPEGKDETTTPEDLTASDTVTVTGTGNSTVAKAGKQISADVIRWTITVNPDQSRVWKAVVEDVLAASPARLKLLTDTVKVDNQTIGTVDTADIYYTYSEVTVTDDEGNTANHDKLAVTFQNASLAGKQCTITFDTRITTNTEYDTSTDTSTDTVKAIKFSNQPTITCYFPDGSGIGEYTWEGAGIEVSAAEQMLSKEYVSYSFDKSTGLITWKLKPSYGNTSFTTAKITDYIGKSESTIDSDTGMGNTHSIHEDTADVCVYLNGTKLTERTDENPDGKWKKTIAEDGKTLTIELYGQGPLSSDGSVTNSNGLSSEDLNKISITYKTHAEDWGATEDTTSGTSKDQSYYNAARMVIDDKTPVSVDAMAYITKNNMITKSAESYYENATSESGFCYTISVNNDNEILRSAVVEDDLSALAGTLGYKKDGAEVTPPEGKEAQLLLTKVVIEPEGSASETITYDADGVGNSTNTNYSYTIENGESLGKLKLNLTDFVKAQADGGGGKKVTVTVYVQIKNSQELFLEGYTVYATNQASVTTETTEGATGYFTAQGGGATQGQIENKRVEKTGVFPNSSEEGEDKTITYTIKVNPWAADMGKVTLTDILTNEGAEYDDENFHLYEAENNGYGTLTWNSESEVTEGWSVSFQTNSDGSRQADITIDSCKKPYVLQYQVLLVEKIGDTVENQVALYSEKSIWASDSDSVNISSMGSATGSQVGSITVKKLYKDPVTGEELPLAGAKFGLIKNSKDNAPSKTAVTNEKGEAVFKGLAQDKDYWVVELEAPEGYEISDNSVRLMQAASTTSEEVGSDTFYDDRTTAGIEFTKTDDSEKHNGLGGAGFLMYYEENGKVRLVQTTKSGEGAYQYVGLTGDSSDASQDRDYEADKDLAGDDGMIISAENGTKGSVKVDGLPWGEGGYYLVEVKGPNGYQANTSKKYRFQVSLAEEEGEEAVSGAKKVRVTYDTASADGCFITDEVNGDTRYLIENTLQVGVVRLTVKKIAADGTLAGYEIPGAKLVLLSDGTAVSDEWQWTTDGYQPLESGESEKELTSAGAKVIQVESGGKDVWYAYQNPDGNQNPKTGYIVESTEDVVYTLREMEAPLGYEKAADIQFSFGADGTVTILSGSEYADVEKEDNGVILTMKDKSAEKSLDNGVISDDPDQTPDDSVGEVDPSWNSARGEDSSTKKAIDTEAVLLQSDTDSEAGGDAPKDPVRQSTAVEAAAEDEAESRQERRSVKTEDRTPLSLYMIIAGAALGVFVLLTVLLNCRQKAVQGSEGPEEK